MDTPTLACTVYRDDVSSGWEIGNPLTTRFHSTLGFLEIHQKTDGTGRRPADS